MSSSEVPEPIEEEGPPKTKVAGRLSEDQVKTLRSLAATSKDVTTQIGLLEIRKMRLLATLADIERQVNHISREEAKKYGVKADTAFQVTPDGDIVVSSNAQLGDRKSD